MRDLIEMDCGVCANHCHMTIDPNRGNLILGNRCPNGEGYARSRLEDPCRIVTGQVRVRSGRRDRCAFRIDKPVPTGSMNAIGAVLRGYAAQAPVHAGEVLIPDIAGTGGNLICTETVEAE